METYNFWQDVFDTYQSQSDFVQIMWIAMPCLTVFGIVVAFIRYKLIKQGHIVHYSNKPPMNVQWYAEPPEQRTVELERLDDFSNRRRH